MKKREKGEGVKKGERKDVRQRNSWKSDNFIGSKREKSSIAIAIMDK